jgi:hypothetical protein
MTPFASPTGEAQPGMVLLLGLLVIALKLWTRRRGR